MEGPPSFETTHDEHGMETRGRARVTRPSLSERTIETLSQIPPSPGSLKKRDGFFYSVSPIRSPSRASSGMTSHSRSPSRPPSAQQNGTDLLPQPPTTMRLPSRSRMSTGPSLTLNHTSTDRRSITSAKSPSRLKKPTPRTSSVPGALSSNTATPPRRSETLSPMKPVYNGSKNTSSKAPELCPASSKAFKRPSEPMMDSSQHTIFVKKTRARSSISSTTNSPSSSSVSKPSSVSSDNTAQERQDESEMRKASKSSTSLRETIAKAKAARKASKGGAAQAGFVDPWESIEFHDPFNQRPKEDQTKVLLLKRVETARTSGHLNISALALKELPNEVMTMYDFDPNSTAGWYESVDLVRLIAADNELTELTDTAFPDVDPYALDPDADERGNQFGGLEVLDLHRNSLQSLPTGFRRLQRLHTLNLSNNELRMDDIHVVMEIETLTDLKLANNALQGSFTSAIGQLSDLETLDLHGNSLTDLPETLVGLTSLKVLNVGENQLETLPFENLSKLSLRELSAPKNKLKGTLIPTTVHQLQNLQTLDVSNNSLEMLSEDEKLYFPSLHTLSIAYNRIKSLPDVSSWQALLTLSAEDNNITDLPRGFVDLKRLRNVDLAGNGISRLDERIGLMDSLTVFRISNNPIRERKFLNMGTEDLKNDLRNRCQLEVLETDDEEGSVATQFTLAPETQAEETAWQVKSGGVLDRSHTDMGEFNVDNLEPIISQDIRCLYLHHNELHSFPTPALSMIADGLTDLDLSNNPLYDETPLAISLTLPNLRTLNLASASLKSLEPLFMNLSAPSLTFLDVSYNRLTGPLPFMRQKYPKLLTFLAADNQISSLEFEAVQGLQVLDVSNNNINSLPPKIGLLRAEGSSKNWGGGSALKRFEVAGNTFRVPRWQIVAKGTDAILEWLKNRIPEDELLQWES